MRIGRYDILSELGRGGMASAFLARAPDGQYVVLKMPLVDDADASERLRDEARTGMRLAHPHIVETLDLFEHEGKPVLVLSYVRGASMYELRTRGPLPPAVVLRVGRQICDALDAIHHATDEHGRHLHILHRDVTAGNIMLADDGNARLIDLGIAKSAESQAARTRSGCMRGTLRYIAPELFMGGDFSHASDLWALGIVLLEAALGRPSFPGKNDAEVVLRIVEGKPLELGPDERLDPRVRQALEWLLQREPARRPRRARDAAALFAMLEKDFPDAQEQAVAALKRLPAPPRPPTAPRAAREVSRVSTEVLVERAPVTKSSGQYELVDVWDPGAFDYDAETVCDVDALESDETSYHGSEPTPAPRPTTPPLAEPPRLEPTGYIGVPRLAEVIPSVSQRRLSTREAILAYAQQLREFEYKPSPALAASELSGERVR